MLETVTARRDAAGRRTGTRILDAALELFNRDGTWRVSTNHIAAHLGISPGNLYYWYPDKQAIVRAIWARFEGERAALWEPADDDEALPSPAATLERLVASAQLGHAYRFLLRDGPALAHTDPRLGEAMAAARGRRLRILGLLARTWRGDGLILPLDDAGLDALVDALWTLTEAWPVHAALGAAPADAGGAGGASGPGTADPGPDVAPVLRAVLEPYLSA